ncbi:MAG: hypothetical protein CMQ40_07985 [Gammaproteobacteria bacterium]|nr:hypothetical protein [Gammaproteobacteria bacterium]
MPTWPFPEILLERALTGRIKMVETKTGHDRSNGISYNDILKSDRIPPPAVYLEDSPYPPGVTTVPAYRYFSREEHDK